LRREEAAMLVGISVEFVRSGRSRSMGGERRQARA
jgi:hypothetical protein